MSDIIIGDRVRYITDIEWGPTKGLTGTVMHVYTDGSILVRPIGESAVYHTLRREVCPISD
jgi:hypothetical protein